MSNTMFDGIIRTPVNKTAALVTTNTNYLEADIELTAQQVQERVFILIEKRKELSIKLGIVTKAQHKNNMHRANTRKNYIATHPQKKLFEEWYRIGQEAARLHKYLAERRQLRREVLDDFNKHQMLVMGDRYPYSERKERYEI